MAIPIGKLALYTAASRHPPGADAAGLARRRAPTTGRCSTTRSTSATARRGCGAPPTTRSSRPSSQGVARGLAGLRDPVGGLQAARTRCGSSTATGTACRRSTTTSRARPRSCWPASSPRCAVSAEPAPTRGSSLAGAGAAGIGIARLLRHAMTDDGRRPEADRAGASSLVDSHGLVHAGRDDLDDAKRRSRRSPAPRRLGWTATCRDLARARRRVRPTILVGTTGVAGTFDEAVDPRRWRRADAGGPIVLPLSNPTSACEAHPADLLALDRRPGARRDRARRSRRSPIDGRRARDRPGEQRVRLPGPRPGRDRRRALDRWATSRSSPRRAISPPR